MEEVVMEVDEALELKEKSCFGEGGDESFNFASHDAIIQNIFRKNFLKYLRIFSKNFLK